MSGSDRERWDRRWAEGAHAGAAVPAWLEELSGELPRGGRALDVAAGTGRVALWLARRGLATLAVDVSPVALERCRARAAADGLDVRTEVRDLERDPLPRGPFDVVSCFHYLQRELFPAFRARLAPGGLFLCELATRRNLERHARPSARFLVEPGELPLLVAPLEVLFYGEGWLGGRALARIAARGPVPV